MSLPKRQAKPLSYESYFDELQERKRLEVQHDIAEILGATLSPKDAIQRVLRKVCLELEWDVGVGWLMDPEVEMLRCLTIWHSADLEIQEFEAITRRTTFPKGKGLPGRIFALGEPTWIVKLSEDPNFPRAGAAASSGLKSGFGFPIILGEKILGVMEFFSRREQNAEGKLVRLMATVGMHVGQFIKKSNLIASLQDSQAWQTAIFNSSLDAIVCFDEEGKVTDFNRAAERMFGLYQGEVTGADLSEVIFPPSQSNEMKKKLLGPLTAPGSPQCNRDTFTAIRSNGTLFPVEIAVSKIHVSGPPSYSCFIRDITEQQEMEKTLRFFSEASTSLSESLNLEVILDKITHLIIPMLADTCIIDFIENDQDAKPARIIHVDKEKAHYIEQLRKAYPVKLNSVNPVAKVFQSGKPLFLASVPKQLIDFVSIDYFQEELLNKIEFGSLIIFPLKAANKTFGTLSIARSHPHNPFTQHDFAKLQEFANRASLAIENARLYQESQQLLRSRDEFLSIASHELKTPLTSLRMQIDLIQQFLVKEEKSEKETQRLRKMTQITAQEMDRMSKLISNLLDVSKIGAGKLVFERKEVDLGALARTVLTLFSEELEAAKCPIEIRVEGPIIGKWDPFRIEQIIINLLSNAMKFGAGKTIRIDIHKSNSWAHLSITDHGIGIAAADHARIFQRFEKALYSKRELGGLGLGLYISLQIARGHGGNIRVESERGKGAKFTLDLPLL